jgi:uncharacterized protein YajQ (UPF0234 family)/CheY-like chemotaxis protein
LRELRALLDVHPNLLGTADDGLHACAFAPVGWAATPIAPDDLRSVLRRAGVLRAGRRRPATVLVAADRATVEAVQSALRQDGVGVIEADTPDPVARVGELQPDLILLDLLKTAAFDAARRLAQHPVARAIPIVALMPDAVGEMDGVRLAKQARQAAASGELLQDEAVSACRTLERLLPERAGLIDHGTRLYTERYLRHCLAEAVERAWGLHRPFSLLVFEADALPADAERGGPPTTERLLRELADLLRRHTRATNPICRLGASVFALVLVSDDDAKLKGVIDILQSKLVKRGVSLKALDYGKIEHALAGTVRQRVAITQGIASDKAKDITKAIRDGKFKVQAQIQSDQLRVTSKSRDELQTVIAFLKEQDFGIPLQFTNYR